MEETGADVRVAPEFLGVISYVGGSGPKIAHFWRMQAVGTSISEPLDDIKAVEWLPLSTAIERLSLAHEQSFLRNVGRKAIKLHAEESRGANRSRRRSYTPPTSHQCRTIFPWAPRCRSLRKGPCSPMEST